MKIKDVYSPYVVSVPAERSVAEAARVMREQHVGDVVVVRYTAAEMIPIGIVTDRDITVGVVAQGIVDLEKIAVADIIQNQLVTAEIDQDLEDAMALMRHHRIRRLPIVNSLGALVGILSYDDIIRSLTAQIASLSQWLHQQYEEEQRRRPS